MIRLIPLVLILLVAACGRSDEQKLRDAANVSDPAAAAVLNEAAEEGVDPQVALEKAAEAAQRNELEDRQRVQARPNLPDDPNLPGPGEPLDTIPVGPNDQNRH